jgi:cobalt-zinc-cadmium efflux system outer membrane protein
MSRHIGWCIPILVLFSTSCARIEHEAELRQAAGGVKRATGLQPTWPEDEGPVRALPLDDSHVVSLDTALELALVNNRALRADLNVIGQAKADLVQAGLLTNPVLSIMLRFPSGGGRSMFDFGVAKDFADLWLIPSKKRAAQAMLQQRILSITDTTIALVNDVRNAYYSLQYLALALDLQRQNQQLIREALEIAQVLLQAGQNTQLDVNLLHSRYLETELEVLQLRSDYHTTQSTLLRLMGQALAPQEWSPTPLMLAAPWTPLATDETPFIDAALEQRLDIAAAHWERESAFADYQQQLLKFLPSLAIGVAGERTAGRALPERKSIADTIKAAILNGAPTVPEFESPSQRRYARSQEIKFLLGPSFEVPLPIFDQNQAQVAKAQYRARELQQRYEELEQRVMEGVRTAVTLRRLAEDRARTYRDELLPLRTTNLRLAETEYQSGRESILTVLLAQEELIRTQLGYAAAVRDLAISAANLERQLAGRLPEPAVEAPASQPTTSPSVETRES